MTELEALMRSGAASRESKHRVRVLTDDIIDIMRGATEAVKLFGEIAKLAGF